MRLSTRLVLAFFTLVMLTAAVGGFALQRLHAVNAAAQEVADSWLPSILLIADTRTAFNRIRRAEADHVLNNDPVQMAEVDKELERHKASLQELARKYEPLISSDAERAAYEQFKKRQARYLEVGAELATLSRNGEKGDTRMLFRGDSAKAFNDAIVELRTLSEINVKGAQAAKALAEKTYETTVVWVGALLLGAIVLAALLAWGLVRSVLRQLGGDPADAADVARRVADGDLSAPVALRNASDQASLMAALKRMQDSLSQIVLSVRGNAEGVATASGQISQGTTDLSSRTEEQASALEQTAASMKELAGTVNQNTASAQDGNRLATEASAVAERGGEVVSRVVDTMKGINESSRRIADIISVIDGIAFQTNILALNAAVEAARAGEQGRGFAVVAGEVRTLAQRSADAAKEIKSLITDSVERVSQGSALVDEAGATMDQVVTSIQQVAQIMSRISTASVEQSAGVAQIGEAVTQMDQATQQNAALVEESAAAADSLRQQAQQLVEAVAVFKLEAGSARMAPPAMPAAETGSRQDVPTLRAVPAPARPARTPEAARPLATGTDDWNSF